MSLLDEGRLKMKFDAALQKNLVDFRGTV